MEQKSVTASSHELAVDELGFFRWGRVAEKILITNDAGDWALLSAAEFDDLLAGRVVDGHSCFKDLQGKGFMRDGLDLDALAARVSRRHRHVRRGPHLHVITLNAQSPEQQGAPGAARAMSRETVEQVVNLAMQSGSPSLEFEIQADGGEPLLNFDMLCHSVDFAKARGKDAGKSLTFRLLSNFSAMSEERAEWLIANDVRVCTTLDGPAGLHDANRRWKPGAVHADVVRWIEYFQKRYAELGRTAAKWQVDALLTVTRETLGAAREVVDEYVARALRTIHLRPLSPSGAARAQWASVGYGVEEYLEFYRNALDHILELNRQGVDIDEATASVHLAKILTTDDPGIVDLQSPNGAGTNQLAYDVDGRVYPCDEARLLAAAGDPIFDLGHAGELNVPDLLRHPTVRAIAGASLLDAQPMCADCWNKPFCGVSPVSNYISQGDLFGQRPHCFSCKEHMGVSRRLFELLAKGDGAADTDSALRRWAAERPALATDARLSRETP